jgi:hypothetical protein
VTWLAFEGSFHFDGLFDAETTRRIYALRVGSGAPEFARTTAERKSSAWADRVRALEHVGVRAEPRSDRTGDGS